MFSTKAIEFWLGRLATDWEGAFSREDLEQGRRLYRDGVVHNIEISDGDATVSMREGREVRYVILEWPQERVEVRSSVTDTAFSQALAVAGLHEIAELVAEEMSVETPELPEEKERAEGGGLKAESESAAVNVNGKVPSGAGGGAVDGKTFAGEKRTAKKEEEVPPERGRKLRVVFSLAAEGLVFDAWWVAGRQLVAASGGGRSEGVSLNAEERGKLIALAMYARRARFVFEKEAGRYLLKSPLEVQLFLKQTLLVWRRSFEVVLGKGVEALLQEAKAVSVEVSVRRQLGGALDLKWIFKVGERLLSEAEVAAVTRPGASRVILPDVGLVSLGAAQGRTFREWGRQLAEAGVADDKVPPYLLFSLFNEEGLRLSLSGDLSAWRGEVEKIGEPEGELRTSTGVVLREYQSRGVAWLRKMGELGCGALLADEMGLGKTLQVLTLLRAFWGGDFGEQQKPRPDLFGENFGGGVTSSAVESGDESPHSIAKSGGDKLPCLVVCPASVVPVWREQAARFYPELRVEVLKGTHDFSRVPDGGVLWLASYAQLRSHRALLAETEFAWAVLDEGQFIKNPDSKAARACCEIRARNRVVLTGTPLENRAADLWSLFHFLMPGLLGSRKSFELAQESAESEALSAKLRLQVAPFVLRRTKAQVAAELPPKMEMDLLCPLSEVQRTEYARICSEGLERLGNDTGTAMRENSFMVLSLLTRLRQACCDPDLLPWVNAPLSESGKISVLLERLAEIAGNGHKVVVFSQFTMFLDRVREAISGAMPELALFELRGSTVDRERPVNGFQRADGAAVMLVSLKAGGTGITLNEADYVFLLDPWWNPAVEAQAIDRVHRIGQRNHVFVYRLVTAGTIEERIQALKASKRDLFERVIGGLGGDLSLAEQFGSLRDLVKLTTAQVASE